jgi:uracil-DNA glycosylase
MSSALIRHQAEVRACRHCPDMHAPPVLGEPVKSQIMLIGQAPGDKEPQLQKPFAWTAGKTLFKWFDQIGLDEDAFRQQVYIAAVCRCFPGKNPKGGDRVPNPDEIAACRVWLDRELALNQPELLLPVGKLAINQFIQVDKLVDVIGQQHRVTINGRDVDVIPLPHPSGASTWHRKEPGISLLQQALTLINQHPAWQALT